MTGLSFVSNAAPQSCCPGDGCTTLIPTVMSPCVNCPPQNRPGITNCGDPAGGCWSADYSGERLYFLGNGREYVCQVIRLTPCGAAPTPTPTPTPMPSPSPSPEPTPVPCPVTSPDNCASGVPRDYCTNPNPPGIDGGGCPRFMHAEGNCCVPDACPSPTPAPPACNGVLSFAPPPICAWTCLTPVIVSEEGGYVCTPYYWVWYVSYDGGLTWFATGQVEYAGCW